MSDKEGAIAAGLVDSELFEPPLDEIAHAAIAFRQQFRKAPGEAHLDDLFDKVLSDPKNKKRNLYQQILAGILEQHRAGINAAYVLSRLNEFSASQTLQAAILEAAERFQRGGENILPEAQAILHGALKFKAAELDTGTFLGDPKRALRFLDEDAWGKHYSIGIPELDHRQIGPTVGRALAFMAAKGRGKSWFCIECGVRAMMQGARVVHVSLEMSEEEITQRYYQRMFGMAKRNEKLDWASFDRDALKRVIGFNLEERKSNLSLDDPKINGKLVKQLREWGTKFNRIVVKRFPSGMLTFAALEAYLDGLELTNRFVPDVLILDYPRLMNLGAKAEFQRVALGQMFVDLRGLAIRRNLAGVFPIQANRQGESVKLITGSQTGEDYSQGQTADILLTYNQTKREHDMGLARIYVDKARGDRDKFTVLIAQAYASGQFCTDSAFMPNNFFKLIKADGEETEE